MTDTANKAKLPVIAIGTAIIAVVIIRFVIGFDGLYGQDGYEYLRYAKALKTYMTNGTPPGDYFWPVGYPLLGALLSFIVQDVGLALQLVSGISLGLVFIFSYKTLRFLFPDHNPSSAVWLSLLMIVLSPYVLRFSFSVMADMLTLASVIMSTYYFLKAGKQGITYTLILGSVFGSLAVMTRYAAIAILIPIAVYGYWMFFKNSKQAFNALPAVVFGIIPLIPHFMIRGSNSADFIQHDWVSQWSLVNFFKNDFHTRDGMAHNALPNIIYALGGLFHPRYCFAAGLIFILGFKKIKLTNELKTIAVGLILYLIFLSGIPYQNNRFLLLALPYFVFILYHPWHWILQKQVDNRKKGIVTMLLIGVMIIQLVLFPFGFEPVYTRNKLEKDIYAYLQTQNNPDIYTMDIDVSLTGRNYPGKIHNIFTQYYEKPDTNALVIFNALTMPFQWNNMHPMNNWQHFNHEYRLTEIKRFDHGWAVHRFN